MFPTLQRLYVICGLPANANLRVANAGIAQVKGLLELSEEDFQHMFSVNVFGVQNCYAAAARQMIKQGNCKPDAPGKIIGVSQPVDLRPISWKLTCWD